MAYCRQQIAADCEELLARFQRTESVRFEVFANIWREMKFSQIFYGITVSVDGKAFSQQVLTTACRYFTSPFTFQIRAGALYLLYALYNNQPSRPKVQIQLALKDWAELSRFQKDAVDAQHFDAVYVLRKMLSKQAFYFAAMPRPLNFRQRKNEKKQDVCEQFMERPSRPQELLSSELLEELSNVHEHYQRCRLSQDPVHPHLVHPDLVSQIHQTVMEFNNWQAKTETPVQAGEDSGEGPSQSESSNRAELLANIKSRSFGQAVEACKWRRHRQVELSSHTAPTAARKPRKQPLKLRANTILIQSDIKKETSKFTKLWRLTTPAAAGQGVPRKRRKFKW